MYKMYVGIIIVSFKVICRFWSLLLRAIQFIIRYIDFQVADKYL